MHRKIIIVLLIALCFVQISIADNKTENTNTLEILSITPLKKPARGEIDDWVRLGNKLLKSGETKKSIMAFRAALGFDEKSKNANFGMGTALIRLGEARIAVDILEPLLAEDPEDYSLRNNLAWLYATAEDNTVRNGKKAVYLAQEALLIAPRDCHVWSTLCEAYYVSGQYVKSLRAAEEAIRLSREVDISSSTAFIYTQQLIKCRIAVETLSLAD